MRIPASPIAGSVLAHDGREWRSDRFLVRASKQLRIDGIFSAPRRFTLPDQSGTIPLLGRAQTWPAEQTIQAANGLTTLAAVTQDALRIAGRAGGTSSYIATLTVPALAASPTLTLPAVTTTLAGYAVAGTFLDSQVISRNQTGATTSLTISNGNAAAGSYAATYLTSNTVTGGIFATPSGDTFYGASRLVAGTISSHSLAFLTSNGIRAELDAAGNLGIGVAPTAGNGLLQLASGTTRANGAWFGDFPVFRGASARLDIGDATTPASLRISKGVTVNSSRTENTMAFLDNASGTKTLRCETNNFQVLNAAFSAVLLSLQDAGNLILGTDPGGSELLRVGGAARINGALTATANGATLNLDRTTAANPSASFLRDTTNTKYNWLVGCQYNFDNGFEITASSAVGGSTYNQTIFAAVYDGTRKLGFFGATPVARPSMAAATGTATRTSFATSTVTLPQLAEAVKALIDDLRAYGLAG